MGDQEKKPAQDKPDDPSVPNKGPGREPYGAPGDEKPQPSERPQPSE